MNNSVRPDAIQSGQSSSGSGGNSSSGRPSERRHPHQTRRSSGTTVSRRQLARSRQMVDQSYYDRSNRLTPLGHRYHPPSSHTSTTRLEVNSATQTSAWQSFQWHILKAFEGLSFPDSSRSSSSTVHTADPNLPELGFSFSPAGLLIPYHLGVAETLRYKRALHGTTPIAGASAGALATAAIACDVPMEITLKIIYRVQDDLRKRGAFRRLHYVLMRELDHFLPPNAHTFINTRPGRTTIAYTNVWPIQGRFVSYFKDHEDLKHCLVASCNIPFYFSRWPTVTCRGVPSVDGFFASSRQFGCPNTSARRDIRILPFPTKSVRVSFPSRDCISPDLQKFDNLLDRATAGQFAAELLDYLQECPAPQPSSTDEQSESSAPVPTPERADAEVAQLAAMWNIADEDSDAPSSSNEQKATQIPMLKYSTHALLQLALRPTEDRIVSELFDLGRADAFRWIKLEETLNSLAENGPSKECLAAIKELRIVYPISTPASSIST